MRRRAADHLQAGGGGDPVEPVPQRRPALEAVQAAPGQQLGLLQGVVGVVERAEHPVAVHVQRPQVRSEQSGERVVIPAAGRGQQAQLLIQRRRRAHTERLAATSDRTDENRRRRGSDGCEGGHRAARHRYDAKEQRLVSTPFMWFDLSCRRQREGGRVLPAVVRLGRRRRRRRRLPGRGSAAARSRGPALSPRARASGRWLPYVVVDDLDRATEQAVTLGATVVGEASDGPAGTSVTIADPGGAHLALFKPFPAGE